MGSGGYSRKAWDDFRTSRRYDDPSTTTDDIYKSKGIDPALDPKGFMFRESVDGDDNPESTPIIVALDVTGSMSDVLDAMAREGLKTVCQEVYERKPVTDPHICVLGIGDVECDRAPFQATQFEADIRIFEQLEKIYLERGGGGNSYESYILAWWFAAFMTKTDSFKKRGRKGFLFTVGDEEITRSLSKDAIKTFMGAESQQDYTPTALLDQVCLEWEVYHIIVKEGSHARSNFAAVEKSWQNVLGMQRVAVLDDHRALGETIVSIIELAAGRPMKDVTASWDGTKQMAIARAVSGITKGTATAIDEAL